MNNKLALTGITGKKSGYEFVNILSENIDMINKMFPGGIVAIVRKQSDIENVVNKISNIEICRGDFYDMQFLTKSLINVKTIVHIANIHTSKNIVDASIKDNVKRIIFVHTTGVYSKYKNASKEYKEIDEYVINKCKENNIKYTICRPTMIYGNIYDKNIIKFVKLVDSFKFVPVVNNAKYLLQPVHYKDLAKAYYSILINEKNTINKEYNLSGEKPIYLKTILEIIANNLKKKVYFINVPFPLAYMGSWIIYIITFGKKDIREKVQRLCEDRVFSHDEATKDFDYLPIPFENGIISEIKEYKS